LSRGPTSGWGTGSNLLPRTRGALDPGTRPGWRRKSPEP